MGIHKSINILTTTSMQRKSLLVRAQEIVALEHGYMSQESLDNYMDWVAGDKQLYEVRIEELKKFYQTDSSGGIFENKLQIESERMLQLACSSLCTSRMIELEALREKIIDKCKSGLDLVYLNKLHRNIYYDVFPWNGSMRTFNFKVAEPLLDNQVIVFMDQKDIQKKMERLINTINMFSADKMFSLEEYHKTVSGASSRIDYRNEVLMACRTFSKFLTSFYQIRPYLIGNILLSSYIMMIKLETEKIKNISIDDIKDYNKDKYFERCIVLGAFAKYLYDTHQVEDEDVIRKNMFYLLSLIYKMGWRGLYDTEDEDMAYAEKNQIDMLSGRINSADMDGAM